MSHWPSVKHFASWLGVAPRHEKSGGKVLRNRTLKTSNRANTALRVAAQAASRSSTTLGAFFRRIKAKHGPAKATIATAHKLARIIYFMLKDRTPYRDLGVDHYTQQQQTHLLRALNRKAKALGMLLIPCNPDEQQPFLSPT
jgi:transposase